MRKITLLALTALVFSANALADDGPLRGDDLKSFLLKKPLQMDRARDHAALQIEFKDDGTLYERLSGNGRKPFGGAGTWKLNDSGYKFCVELQGSNQTDCMGILRQGAETFVFSGATAQPVIYGKVME